LCIGSLGFVFETWYNKSGVNREVHAPFCERLGAKLPLPAQREKIIVTQSLFYPVSCY